MSKTIFHKRVGMVLDMNIELDGIDEAFLDELDELIEDYRVEYFIINPLNKEELDKTQKICSEYERFKYTLPVQLKEYEDKACVAIRVTTQEELMQLDLSKPLVIDSNDLNSDLIDTLNESDFNGIILNAKESNNCLENFAYAVSHDSLQHWTNKGMTDTDFNKLVLQSDYPNFTYDDLFDELLKNMSDMTFRAEQSIASGGTRTALKTFKLL